MKVISSPYDKRLFEKAQINPYKDYDTQFKSLVIKRDVLSLLIINKFLPKISCFDDECIKYYSMLTDMFKYQINNSAINESKEILIINSSISNFIKVFHSNFQTYNDKHKSITKQFPNFLQLLFKYLKNNYATNGISSKKELKILESFFIIILTFINYYPTLLRSYQQQIEQILQKVFSFYLLNSKISIDTIKTFIIIYSSLYYLSPSIETKMNFYLQKIVANLNYVLTLYKPKSIDQNDIKEPDSIFYEKIKQNDLVHSCKVVDLLFEIMKCLFKLIPINTIVNVDFSLLFNFFYNTLTDFNNDIFHEKKHSLIISGLSQSNYELFISNLVDHSMKEIIFFLDKFPSYICCYYQTVSKIMQVILYNQKISQNFNLYKMFFELCKSLILSMSKILPNIVDEIIFKHIYSIFGGLYFEFLEKNDKTVIKIDNAYFKLGNKKKELSLIQKNSLKTTDKLFSHLSNEEHTEILINVLSVLNAYMLVDHYSVVNNSNGILSGIIDLLILPSYAKFLFYLDQNVKKRIVILLENCVRMKKVQFNRGKLLLFLKGFYTKNEELRCHCDLIINLLNLTDKDIANIQEDKNDITDQIISFNSKISDLIKKNNEIIQLGIEKAELLGKKRENEQTNKEKIIKSPKKEIKESKNEPLPIQVISKEPESKETKKEDKEMEETPIISRDNKDDIDLEEDIEIPDII